MFAIRILYFLWLIFHISALIASGWFDKISFKKGVSWSELIGYSSKFYPIQTLDLANYDITEFIIYYAIIPFYVYKFVSTVYMWGKKY
ncbi:MAG: hypothetical protein A2057_01150 [Ignavibacteria bacterium GWA2_35_9]|nr:MAG: hypothetical protein A2057_01150 [Ignavibacteria bacterium GWA2_35_9]OGU50473.1 MAG: hypothetical protein A2080_11405 [Ignavibacteria bacterium GWC2_36_12]